MPTLLIEGTRYQFDGISNAGGICKNFEEIKTALESAADEVELGSITLDFRDGNTDGVTTYYDEKTGNFYNSLGIPNLGWRKDYKAMLIELLMLAKKAGKKLRVNIAEFTPLGYVTLAVEITALAAKHGLLKWLILVVNSSCPNCWEDGKPPAILAYSPKPFGKTLRSICSVAQGVIVAVKISPYDKNKSGDLVTRAQIAREIAQVQDYRGLLELVISNTVPNQRPTLPNGKDAIGVTNGFAGGSGPMLQPYVEDNLAFFSNALPRIQLVAAGGVESGPDVINYIKRGATKIQIAAAIARRKDPKGGIRPGFRIFSEIYQELASQLIE